MAWLSRIPECPVFRPSEEEFRDPMAYIQSIRPQAERAGICKISPPPGMMESLVAPATVLHKQRKFRFTTRVQTLRTPKWGCTKQQKPHFLKSGRTYSLPEFERAAASFAGRMVGAGATMPAAAAEAHFWRELEAGQLEVEYGSDLEGTAFSSQPADALAASPWNLRVLPRLEGSILRQISSTIPGLTDPMLYIGMLYSMFAWHVEDHFLYSINYHHMGAPKVWYGVPGDLALSFEAAALRKLSTSTLARKEGLAGAQRSLLCKTSMFPPSLLLDAGVPTFRAVQHAGEFVVTFPRAYHGGFSTGFNCGEAVNFGTADWIPFSTAAERRYAVLRHSPLLCHEEVLVKEAQQLWERLQAAAARGDPSPALTEGPSQATQPGQALPAQPGLAPAMEDAGVGVMREFVQLLRLQDRASWWLVHKRGARRTTLPQLSGPMPCSLCLRLCYLSIVTCACQPEPICLHHASLHKQCRCGARREVAQRHGMGALVRLAKDMDWTLALRQQRAGQGQGQGAGAGAGPFLHAGAVADIEAYAPGVLQELQGCWEAGCDGYAWLDPGPGAVPTAPSCATPGVSPSGASRAPGSSSSGTTASPPSVGSPFQGPIKVWARPRAPVPHQEAKAGAPSVCPPSAATPFLLRGPPASDGLPVLLPLQSQNGPKVLGQGGPHRGPMGREGQQGASPAPASPTATPGLRAQREDGVAPAGLRALASPGQASSMRLLLQMQSLGSPAPSVRSPVASAPATTSQVGQHAAEVAIPTKGSQGGEPPLVRAQATSTCLAGARAVQGASQAGDVKEEREEQLGAGAAPAEAAQASTQVTEAAQASQDMRGANSEGVAPAAKAQQLGYEEVGQKPGGGGVGQKAEVVHGDVSKPAGTQGGARVSADCTAPEGGPLACFGAVEEGQRDPRQGAVRGRGRGKRTRRQLCAKLLGPGEAKQANAGQEAAGSSEVEEAADARKPGAERRAVCVQSPLHSIPVAQGAERPLQSSAVARGAAAGQERGAEAGQGRGAEAEQERGAEAGQERGGQAGQERGAEAGQERGAEAGLGWQVEAGMAQGVEAGPDSGAETGLAVGLEAGQEQRGEVGVEEEGTMQVDDSVNDAATQGHGAPNVGDTDAAKPLAAALEVAEATSESGRLPEVPAGEPLPGAAPSPALSLVLPAAAPSPALSLVLPAAPGAAGSRARPPAPFLGLDLNLDLTLDLSLEPEGRGESPRTAWRQAAGPRPALLGALPEASLLAPRVLATGGPPLQLSTEEKRASLGDAASSGWPGQAPHVLGIPAPLRGSLLLHIPPMLLDAVGRGRLHWASADLGGHLPQLGAQGLGGCSYAGGGAQGSKRAGAHPAWVACALPGDALLPADPSGACPVPSWGAWQDTEGSSQGPLQRSFLETPAGTPSPLTQCGAPLSASDPQAWGVAGEGVPLPAKGVGSTPAASPLRAAGAGSLDAVLALALAPRSGHVFPKRFGLDSPEHLSPRQGSPLCAPSQASPGIYGIWRLLPAPERSAASPALGPLSGRSLSLLALPQGEGEGAALPASEDPTCSTQGPSSGAANWAPGPSQVLQAMAGSEDCEGGPQQSSWQLSRAALSECLGKPLELEGCMPGEEQQRNSGGRVVACLALPAAGSKRSPRGIRKGSGQGKLGARLVGSCGEGLRRGQEGEGGAAPASGGLQLASPQDLSPWESSPRRAGPQEARPREAGAQRGGGRAGDGAAQDQGPGQSRGRGCTGPGSGAAQDQGTAGPSPLSRPGSSEHDPTGLPLVQPDSRLFLIPKSVAILPEGPSQLHPLHPAPCVEVVMHRHLLTADARKEEDTKETHHTQQGGAGSGQLALAPPEAAGVPSLACPSPRAQQVGAEMSVLARAGEEERGGEGASEAVGANPMSEDAPGAACLSPSSTGAQVRDDLQPGSPSSRHEASTSEPQARSMSRPGGGWSSVPKRRRTNWGRAPESHALTPWACSGEEAGPQQGGG